MCVCVVWLPLRYRGVREERCVKVLESICRFSDRHSKLVDAFKKTFEFYNCLAEAKFGTRRTFNLSQIASEKAELYSAWKSCCVSEMPVITLTHSPSEAETLITVSKFDDQVCISSAGKSLPKILTLYDSDGYRHRQLVKSDDDVRQDRTVQTVLSSINCVSTLNMGIEVFVDDLLVDCLSSD